MPTNRPPLTYAAAVAKGKKLLELTKLPAAVQPPFQDTTELKKWGYRTSSQRSARGFYLCWQELFLQWVAHTPKEQVRNLRYIIKEKAVNAETKAVLKRIMHNENIESLPAWPGIEFDMQSEHGTALLGTPSGASVGWKTVDKVLVFQFRVLPGSIANRDGEVSFSLLFQVVGFEPEAMPTIVSGVKRAAGPSTDQPAKKK